VRRRHRKSDCPIHFALEVFGDAWTLLIIRDLFRGRTTYTELLRAREGIATNVLADRLLRLEEDGMISKESVRGRGNPTHYQLTSKGLDLLPILLAIVKWSIKYDPQTVVSRDLARRRRAALRRAAAAIRAQLRKQDRSFHEPSR
jgi:DNA-binding HxlR family transcriptional regulator